VHAAGPDGCVIYAESESLLGLFSYGFSFFLTYSHTESRCVAMRTNGNLSPPIQKRPRGRPFAKGNGGRKLGSRNRATLLADALLEGEQEELVRKGIELAKAGDPQMLKFFLDRILPKERPVKIDLPPIEHRRDLTAAYAAIVQAVGAGELAPGEGSAARRC